MALHFPLLANAEILVYRRPVLSSFTAHFTSNKRKKLPTVVSAVTTVTAISMTVTAVTVVTLSFRIKKVLYIFHYDYVPFHSKFDILQIVFPLLHSAS